MSDHEHSHDHGHDHGHGHAHDHDHGPAESRWSRLRHQAIHLVKPHSHDSADKTDSAMEASAEGIRTLWIGFGVLGATALIQAAIVILTGSVDGVRGVGQVRLRWIGHNLRAEADIVVDPALTVVQAHALAVAAEHALIHAVPRLTAATVHTDHALPAGAHQDPHAELSHHGVCAANAGRPSMNRA
jgi:hypothetical protein